MGCWFESSAGSQERVPPEDSPAARSFQRSPGVYAGEWVMSGQTAGFSPPGPGQYWCHVPEKQPFDIDAAMDRIRDAVRPYPPAALFQLADEGFSSAFEQLVACMISIRTRDETTLPVARRFFAV